MRRQAFAAVADIGQQVFAAHWSLRIVVADVVAVAVFDRVQRPADRTVFCRRFARDALVASIEARVHNLNDGLDHARLRRAVAHDAAILAPDLEAATVQLATSGYALRLDAAECVVLGAVLGRVGPVVRIGHRQVHQHQPLAVQAQPVGQAEVDTPIHAILRDGLAAALDARHAADAPSEADDAVAALAVVVQRNGRLQACRSRRHHDRYAVGGRAAVADAQLARQGSRIRVIQMRRIDHHRQWRLRSRPAAHQPHRHIDTGGLGKLDTADVICTRNDGVRIGHGRRP
ncbi:hypothetical protein DUGA6_61900 [Duganella sp. HH105]|nr:hypothetical protein DUGA6_61900 [Duganella sp. HH105]